MKIILYSWRESNTFRWLNQKLMVSLRLSAPSSPVFSCPPVSIYTHCSGETFDWMTQSLHIFEHLLINPVFLHPWTHIDSSREIVKITYWCLRFWIDHRENREKKKTFYQSQKWIVITGFTYGFPFSCTDICVCSSFWLSKYLPLFLSLTFPQMLALH